MMDKGIGVFIAIVGLASIAVIVSKKSATAKVLESLFAGFSKSIRSAIAPVTGK
jgi:xanthine/uracil/vitamin C permease (AzgA family)